MIDFITNNYGTIIVGAILLAVVAGIVYKLVKDKKKGKCGCCSECKFCDK